MLLKRLVFLLLPLIISVGNVRGQESNIIRQDTAEVKANPIPRGDITIKATEIRIRTKQAIRDLIPDGTVRKLKAQNDAILASINPRLLAAVDSEDPSINIRFLENRRIELQLEQLKINDQKAELTQIVHYLEDFKYQLLQDHKIWNLTKDAILKDSLTVSIPVNLTETVNYIDSLLVLVSHKSTQVMGILDQTISAGSIIDNQLEKTQALIASKQLNSFNPDHAPLFRLKVQTDYEKEIFSSYYQKNSGKLTEFLWYLRNQPSSVLIALTVFFSLIYLVIRIRKLISINNQVQGYFYKKKFLEVLSHPVNAAIILTLLSTTFIFPGRPMVFREIGFYILAFPLIHTLSILLEKKFKVYLYAFGLLIVLNIFQISVSSESFIYRILLLVISITEIILFTLFLIRFSRKNEFSKTQKILIFGFIILHLGLSVIGLVSNISGRVTLTEILHNAVFANIFYLVALLISALLLNGFIVIGIDTSLGQQLRIFRLHGELIKKRSVHLVNLALFFFGITLMFRNFRMLDYVYNGISSILTFNFRIGSTSFSLDTVLIFFVVIYVSIVLSNLLRILLEEDILSRFSLSKGLPHTIAMLVKYTLITAGFFLAVSAAGIPVDKLTLILGAMSVGIGFGLQSVFNNLVSGLILLVERPIQLGDTVQVGQLTGNVKSIGLRASNVTTFEGAEVIVPNSQLVANEVINWTLSDQNRRLELAVGVAYNSDPELVYRLLADILDNHAELVKDPKPLVFFDKLGESSLDFTLLFWINDYIQGRRIKSEILFSIFRVLKENKIEIPFPQRDLHVKSVSPVILTGQTIVPAKKIKKMPTPGKIRQ